jgi:hypothetical protein
MISAYIIGLVFRITNNIKAALKFSIPTLLVNIYVYSIRPFFDPNIMGDDILNLGFQIMFSAGLFLYSMLCSFLMANMLIFGSRVRIK